MDGVNFLPLVKSKTGNSSFFARAPVILHKQSIKILDWFVYFAYCNLCAPMLYYNRQGERKVAQAADGHRVQLPRVAPKPRNFLKRLWKTPWQAPQSVL